MTQLLARAPDPKNYAEKMLHNLFFCLDHAAREISEGLCKLMIFVIQEEPVKKSQFQLISSEWVGT
jgi:hypothetical protein